MLVFSINHFLQVLEYIHQDGEDAVLARSIYNEYLKCNDLISNIIKDNPDYFRMFLMILRNRNIIDYYNEGKKTYIYKVNFINYNEKCIEEDSVIDGCKIKAGRYTYDFIKDTCFIDGVVTYDKELQEKIRRTIYRDNIFIMENQIVDKRKLNEKYQEEFDTWFLNRTGNERKQFMFSLKDIVDYQNPIYQKSSYGSIHFFMYDEDETYTIASIRKDDFIDILKKLCEDVSYDDSMVARMIIPSWEEIDYFLEKFNCLNPKKHVVGDVSDKRLFKVLFLEYMSNSDFLEDLLISNVLNAEYLSIPEEIIQNFALTPFGKEYCDLTEKELEEYSKIMAKMK